MACTLLRPPRYGRTSISSRLALLAVVLIGLLCSLPAAAVAQVGADPFELRGNGGKCVDGAGAQLFACNGAASQRWTRPGDGTLRALGRCLDVAGGSRSNGARIQLWTCNGTGAQLWRVGDGNTLVNPQSGRCLDATNWGTADGTPLQIWACGTGQTNQRWQVPPAGGRIGGLGGSCVDVAGASATDGAGVQLWGCNGTSAQHWVHGGDGTVRALGKCLDVAGAGTGNGTRVQLWACNGNGAQQWRSGDGSVLVNPQSGRCLDATGGATAAGTPLQLWDCAPGQVGQSWAPVASNPSSDRGRFRALVFSKTTGFRHTGCIAEGTSALRRMATPDGYDLHATENSAEFTDANLTQYDVVVFLCTTGDVLNPSEQSAFERYIRAGGGYVGVHSASDTEYDWPWYGGLVGAYFRDHPGSVNAQFQRATIRVEDGSSAATAHLGAAWTREEEWYNFQTNPRARVHVLLSVDESTYDPRGFGQPGGSPGMGDHPIAWCQRYDGGRAFYTGLGHKGEYWSDAALLRHVIAGMEITSGVRPSNCG